MTLEQANNLISFCSEQMNARYRKVVFDEWAIVSLVDNKVQVLAYRGPRQADFQKSFVTDMGALRARFLHGKHQIGDFEFSRDSAGTAHEAFMAIGCGLYVICNNTVQTMDAIAKDPKWLGAQVAFVDMSERFVADPLQAPV